MAGIFRKPNTTGYPDALICEAEGLQYLSDALRSVGVSGIRVPEVMRVDEQTLELTRIQASSARESSLVALGEGLAALHQREQNQHGWHRDNFIGLSPQPNRWAADWGDFFVQDRLGYQVSRISAASVRRKFETILDDHGGALSEWLSRHCEHASLLHGDLWSGNVMFDREGPWLIDPAVYCGDREADLAMTEMFGGFGPAFYRAYDRVYPRTSVYEQKRTIYNLYHYLNHYNLFGGSYLWGCERGLVAVQELGMRAG